MLQCLCKSSHCITVLCSFWIDISTTRKPWPKSGISCGPNASTLQSHETLTEKPRNLARRFAAQPRRIPDPWLCDRKKTKTQMPHTPTHRMEQPCLRPTTFLKKKKKNAVSANRKSYIEEAGGDATKMKNEWFSTGRTMCLPWWGTEQGLNVVAIHAR